MKRFVNLTASTSMLLLLGGCLENKSGTGPISSSSIMSGVAATGAPISNGKVEIKGRNGKVVQKTTASDGSYSASIKGLEEPYLVRVIAPSGEKYISVASKSDLAEGKKINVTPLSHTIVANVFADADADQLFADFETKASDFSESKLLDEKEKLVQKFIDAGLLGNGKIAGANIDLLNGDLKAGTSIGLDGLLDVIDVNTGASGGVEIKMKGEAAPFIVDKVDDADDPVVDVSGSVTLAKTQLTVIDAIRQQMNSLASQYSSYTSCNGVPKDDGSACDVDTIHTALKAYFHADFQEDGLNRDASVWSWVCDGNNGDRVISKAACLASTLEFRQVHLKDITLISYDDASKSAVISLNIYQDGKLGHSEEMSLRLDVGNNKYKMLGNKKTFEYWIDSESVHATNINKTTGSVQESYNVNLNFYYRDSAAHNFSENQSFTLSTVSNHGIFPQGSDSMTLYLVKGPVYDNQGVCSEGLTFSTTLTPYKVYSHETGVESMLSYANACTNNDACNCQDNGKQAWFDHETSRMVKIGLNELSKMDKFERVTLTGNGVNDEFVIRKPLLVNALNAKTYIPQFGMTSAAFCANTDVTMPFNLTVASGTLNGASLHYGVNRNGTWLNESAHSTDLNEELKSWTFQPSFSSLQESDEIEHSHIYLSSRDEFERRFVRQVSCFK